MQYHNILICLLNLCCFGILVTYYEVGRVPQELISDASEHKIYEREFVPVKKSKNLTFAAGNNKYTIHQIIQNETVFDDMVTENVKAVKGMNATIYNYDIINPHPYKFTFTNEHLCEKDMLFIILVSSRVHKPEVRAYIRQSYAAFNGFNGLKFRTAFLLGMPGKDSIQADIEKENAKYGDLIQQNFVDTYNNLTIKSMMMLQWCAEYCKDARYYVRTDDDMMIDTPWLVMEVASQMNRINQQNPVVCYYRYSRREGPLRGYSKWDISYEEYPFNVYPPHCKGPLYVIYNGAAKPLWEMSLRTKHIFIDDVFITGLITLPLGIKPKPPFSSKKFSQLRNRYNRKSWSYINDTWGNIMVSN